MAWTKKAPKEPGVYWIAADTAKKKKVPTIEVFPAILHKDTDGDLRMECAFREKPLTFAMLWWDTPTATAPPKPDVEPIVKERKEASKRKFTVVVQKWEESEAGWGTRPDGWTIHLNEEDRKKFVEKLYSTYPKDHVPHEYTRTDGSPYLMDVDQKLYDQLRTAVKKGEFGTWGPGNSPPKPGVDGWMPVASS